MKQSKDHKYIPMTSVTGGKEREVREDLYLFTNQIVNLIFLGKREDQKWVLVDAGMPKSAREIISVARKRFGENKPPAAIILTHGHFDHIGSIVDLVEEWKVPVYAHPEEFPFLTGKEAYPKPDAGVEGGMLAKVSFIYPHKPIDISPVLKELPTNGDIPHLPEWKWVHTPGHSPGHVSLFRESDKSLLPGDAFTTVKQDSFYRVLLQKKEINGPPVYLTTDWKAARDSVERLTSLEPELVVPGHGPAMSGDELTQGLKRLARNFGKWAVPDHGRYVTDGLDDQ